MKETRTLCLVLAAACVSTASYAAATAGRHFEWTTQSAEAKKMLVDLQSRVENFQAGPENLELAKKLVARAKRKGARQAEAYVESGRHSSVRVRDGEIEDAFHRDVQAEVSIFAQSHNR